MNKRINADDRLKEKVNKRLSELPDEVTQRCFVSKKTKEYLTKALQGEQ